MGKTVSAAQAKARFSDLIAQVAFGGERFVIERRGKPVAALISIKDLKRLEEAHDSKARPLGALALVGAWGDVEEADLESVIASIYAERERETGRAIELED
jgi:prevent-host-death family protein